MHRRFTLQVNRTLLAISSNRDTADSLHNEPTKWTRITSGYTANSLDLKMQGIFKQTIQLVSRIFSKKSAFSYRSAARLIESARVHNVLSCNVEV